MTEEMIEDISEEMIEENIIEQENENHELIENNENQPQLTIQQLKMFIEAALLATDHPMSVEQIRNIFDEFERPAANEIREVLQLIAQECENRGIELIEVASGFRFQIKMQYSMRLGKLWEEKPPRYSRALLETLALIAYRQPITRAEIEDIRGVVVSSHIIKILLDREWIRVVGHRDVPGKPGLYATTKQFLDYFNMKSLAELPTLTEIKNLDILADQIEAKGSSEINGNNAHIQTDDVQVLDETSQHESLSDITENSEIVEMINVNEEIENQNENNIVDETVIIEEITVSTTNENNHDEEIVIFDTIEADELVDEEDMLQEEFA